MKKKIDKTVSTDKEDFLAKMESSRSKLDKNRTLSNSDKLCFLKHLSFPRPQKEGTLYYDDRGNVNFECAKFEKHFNLGAMPAGMEELLTLSDERFLAYMQYLIRVQELSDYKRGVNAKEISPVPGIDASLFDAILIGLVGREYPRYYSFEYRIALRIWNSITPFFDNHLDLLANEASGIRDTLQLDELPLEVNNKTSDFVEDVNEAMSRQYYLLIPFFRRCKKYQLHKIEDGETCGETKALAWGIKRINKGEDLGFLVTEELKRFLSGITPSQRNDPGFNSLKSTYTRWKA